MIDKKYFERLVKITASDLRLWPTVCRAYKALHADVGLNIEFIAFIFELSLESVHQDAIIKFLADLFQNSNELHNIFEILKVINVLSSFLY